MPETNCPCCGVNIKQYQREHEEKVQRNFKMKQRDEEFESTYRDLLKRIRRNSKILHFVFGAIIMSAMLFAGLSLTIYQVGASVTENGWRYILGASVLFGLSVGGTLGLTSYGITKPRKERKLRDAFCLTHTIE